MHVGKKVQLGNIRLVQSHHVPLPGHEHGEAGGGVHEHGLERVQEVAEHDREGLPAHLLEDLEGKRKDEENMIETSSIIRCRSME